MKTIDAHLVSDGKYDYDRPLENLFILYAAVLPVSISAANIALFMIMVLGFYRLYKAKINVVSILDKRLTLACIALFSWAAIVALVKNGYIQKLDISNIWEYSPIIVFPLFLSVAKIRKEKVVFTLLIFASIVCLLGIVQFIFPEITYPFPKQPGLVRFKGFQSHHLHAGGVYSLTTIVALSLILFWQSDNRKKAYLWMFFLLNLVALILTMSRAYYVALFFVLPLMIYITSKRTFFVAVVMMALSLIIIMSFQNFLHTRVKSIFNFKSNRARIQMWEASYEMVKDYPLMGVGKSNWTKDAKEIYFPKIGKTWRPPYGHAHNIYIVWLSETGIIGICLFLFFWFLSIKRLLSKLVLVDKGSFDYVIILSGLFGLATLAVAGFFENNFETSIILLVIGPLIGLSLSGEEHLTKESSMHAC